MLAQNYTKKRPETQKLSSGNLSPPHPHPQNSADQGFPNGCPLRSQTEEPARRRGTQHSWASGGRRGEREGGDGRPLQCPRRPLQSAAAACAGGRQALSSRRVETAQWSATARTPRQWAGLRAAGKGQSAFLSFSSPRPGVFGARPAWKERGEAFCCEFPSILPSTSL
jgi:hypothetical protein